MGLSDIYDEDSKKTTEADTETSLSPTTSTARPSTDAHQLVITNKNFTSLRSRTTSCSDKALSQSSHSTESSYTIFDEEHNALLAESWSAPTYTERECTETPDKVPVARTRLGSYCLASDATSNLQIITNLKTHLSKYSTRKLHLSADCLPPSRKSSTTASNLEKMPKIPPHKKTHSPMERFLLQNGSAPWSMYNMRRPHTICAYCALAFTGPRHREEATRHTHDSHMSSQKSSSLRNSCTQRVSRLAKSHVLSHCATKQTSWDAKSINSFIKQTATSPIKTPDTYKVDTTALGSWLVECNSPNSDSETQKKSSTRHPCAFRPCPTVCVNSAPVDDHFAFLLNGLSLQSHVGSTEIFFKGLNIIVENLLKRCPNDAVVQGMHNALTRLERSYLLTLGASSLSDEHTTTAGYSDPNTCASLGDNGYTFLSGVTNQASSRHCSANRQQQSNTTTIEPRGLTSNVVQNATQKSSQNARVKRKIRLLGCPIQKHHKVHALESPCRFKGAANVSGITQHLNTRAHHEFLPFLKLCRDCWEYVTSEDAYQELHELGRCQQISQPRGSRVAEHWYRLYKKIYPMSERIPRPYIDDATWRSTQSRNNEDMTTLGDADDLELDFNTLPGSQAFLEVETTLAPDIPLAVPATLNHTQRTIMQNAEAAALRLYFQMHCEHMNQPGTDSQHMVYIVRHASQVFIDVFSDTLHARLNASIPPHRTRVSEDPRQNLTPIIMPDSLALTTSSGDVSGLEQLPALEGSEETRGTIPPFQSLSHEEPSTEHDLFQHDGLSNLTSTGFDYYLPTFYPEIDLAQTPHQLASFGIEETQSMISI